MTGGDIMKMNRIINTAMALAAITVLASSCDKFLDKMPDNRAEIDSQSKIRAILTSAYPNNTYLTFSEYMSDNVDNIGDDNPGTSRFVDQCYAWEEITEITNDCPKYFWGGCYEAIAHANQALLAIQELSGCEDELDPVKVAEAGLGPEMAEALLCRAYNHFQLVNFFCLAYNAKTADKDLGVPYMEGVETELNPQYERGTVKEDYEKIEKDILIALDYVNDAYYKVPKYHFNVKAAWALATRFWLFYEKWDKAVEAATNCLGSQPGQVLRNWQARSKLEHDRTVLSNDFINSSYDSNLLLMTSYTQFGYYFGYPGITKYSHNSYLSFTEVSYAKNVWGNAESGWRNVSSWYWDPPVWYNGSTFDQIAFWKIPYLFEYTDPVAGIGYAHAVAPAFTMDEVLLSRAEAYAMLGDYDNAAADLNTWAHNMIRPSYFTFDLTKENIVDFYSAIPYWKPNAPTIKKHLNPSFKIGVENSVQECLLQCALGFKRIENVAQGLRWLDIKRYGIVVYRRTMEPDPDAAQYDAALRVKNGEVDSLSVNDLRRAMQIPADVISAGLEPNPRPSN